MAKFKDYFTARYVLSKNALFSLILSDRSDGKTFDCAARALIDYKEHKHITIYMRRFKTEIDALLAENFFEKVLAEEEYKEFRNWEFKANKQGVKVKTSKENKWDWIVLFLTLSTASRKKSVIDNLYKRIFIIDYDEVIPMDGRYLANEPQLLMDVWKTVDRDRDILQMVILGNRISPFCPYFDFWNISLNIINQNLKMYQDDTVAVQIYTSKEHREEREKSRFRKAISGTEYENYDKGGILFELNLKKSSIEGIEYWGSFKSAHGEGSIWYNGFKMVISERIRKDGIVLTDKIYNLNRENYLVTFGKFPLFIKNIYRSNSMYFETEKAFYLFEPLLNKVGAK